MKNLILDELLLNSMNGKFVVHNDPHDTYKYLFHEGKMVNIFKVPSVIEFKGEKFKITEIDDKLFENCINLRQVILDDSSIVKIGKETFKNCKDLEKVTLPSTLKEIGNEAFKDCKYLKKPEIDERVLLGENVFLGCAFEKPQTLQDLIDEKSSFKEINKIYKENLER